MWKDDAYYFNRAVAVAREALTRGDDGFASLLVDAQGEILMEQSNVAFTQKNPLAHDTIVLVNRAVKEYSRDFLSNCTVYAVLEPCVMCTASAFWAGIDKIKFAMAESELEEILPGGLSISSREFVKRSPRPMSSVGPFSEITEARGVVRDWVHSLGIPVAD